MNLNGQYMLKLLAIALSVAFLLLGGNPSSAHDHQKDVEIVDAWAPEPTSLPTSTLPVYLSIHNHGSVADRIIAARSNVSASVELRSPDAAPLESIAVAANGDVVLHAQGPHLLLVGVNRDLRAHDSFKAAVEFQNVGRIVVDVYVGDPATHDHRVHEPHKH